MNYVLSPGQLEEELVRDRGVSHAEVWCQFMGAKRDHGAVQRIAPGSR